jgi:hypothetical protein
MTRLFLQLGEGYFYCTEVQGVTISADCYLLLIQ